ncbi:MAG: tRNA 4-thiouridine(8) synthase ThiI [Candidatus Lokiarchaeota archaeon]|nr:tRNA 4-thiouridine(8) synthase ThiI [Candidatus Lokiarchaeota archaeon]
MNDLNNDRPIGLGLISGGLDSLIACLVLKLQNIKVIGLNFKSPFCICEKAYKNAECGLNLYYDKLGIKTYYLQKEDDYLEVIQNPKFGYGKNLNPCIDCRIYILKKAKLFAEQINADFIFTGEVLDQRPKSQNLKALRIIEEESDLKGILLRPLSALLLKPTTLEKKGLIERSKLLGIKGRSRKKQLELARSHGILNEYNACGGCLLTEKDFANRMRDYLKFNKEPSMVGVRLLKYGRHFRFNGAKIIIGRNELENNFLIHLKESNGIIMEASNVKGPITLIQGNIDEAVIKFAARLTLRYSDALKSRGEVIYGREPDTLNEHLTVEKGTQEFLTPYLL